MDDKAKTVASLQFAAILAVIFGWFAYHDRNILLAFVSGYLVKECKDHIVKLLPKRETT